jgi:predicted amidohydrolase YtcJ
LGEGQLRLSGVKIILDETTGRLHPPQAELNEMVLKIHRLGMQVAIHAIEETAVESACSAIAYALKESPNTDHRHHIEHCSVCPPSLAKRLASLGIMVVTQPSFIYYNGDRYLETVPAEQMKHPMLGISAAVSRGTAAGNVLTPEEGVVPLKALQMYTCNGAEATFEEKIKGSITPGKMADIVVLSGDLTRVSPEDIKDLKVEMTILNGEVVWEDKA